MATESGPYPSILQVAVVATALKVLLFPAYKSTDFEVHRNWLAITNSLPVKEWYYEKTSEWTLDYPPFFAYSEWILSQFANVADPLMVQVQNLNYSSWQTIYFQRTTVLLSELFLLFALNKFIQTSPVKSTAHAAAIAIFLSPGLFIIDHIHFQYNGFMYGILILSFAYAQRTQSLLASGLIFAALLCFKHIYLYLAPAYFIFLLRAYCLKPRSLFSIRWGNCIKLGSGIVAIFAAAFGPFALWGQMPQVLSRLFPFSRGLCHAYWAPNVWAMYSFADRVLLYAAPYLKLPVDASAVHSVTRGLVGDTAFAVLPEITPRMTFLLSIATQLPPLAYLFLYPSDANFLPAVTLTAYSSFLFGWHVHEKAILLVLIPFTLICLRDRRHFAAYLPLAVAGHVSLFPLLFTPQEWLGKIVYTLFWLIAVLYGFDQIAPASNRPRVFLLDRFSVLYTTIAIPLLIYTSVVHQLVFRDKFEFIPLMFTSTYCAIGVVGSWLGFLVVYFTS
ncbi:dolichyl glycosyltransferase [Microthyrium microscopicum]|uniref:Alpha-1,3-glucosyltransferase n=1 Tax=Microthyrium microscopicum TaxID=703497 RepID=A0A6A6UVH5_9PEZI|nr:dolichyl glycosyltransferase [Microthyrium microscopicum]